jgi:FAD/FMN-containing dehydrogenase
MPGPSSHEKSTQLEHKMAEARHGIQAFAQAPIITAKADVASSKRYEDKKQALSRQMKESAGEVRLRKETSNLFRERVEEAATRLRVSDFNQVIDVDTKTHTVDVEGMTSFEKLAAAAFANGMLPAVIPQLKSITIGGAVAGLGIEASSFRYGLVHETVQEIEVLLADGDTVLCTPNNEHRDLFFGLPNSYGTLGYALRVKAKVVPAKPYVALQHVRHNDPRSYFRDLESFCGQDIDFIDGVVFSPTDLYLTVGRFVDSAPYTSDYTYRNIYYRSIRERREDYLTALDYIWRWDTDWFWCSRVLFAQNPIIRRLLGKRRLNSTFYKKVSDWNNRRELRQRLRQVLGIYSEPVIQDVDIPIANAGAFLDFFQREIGLSPIWICPFRSYDRSHVFPLFPTDPKALYVNFGFWDAVTTRTPHEEGYFNRLIEKKVVELGGIKSLYSDSYFEEDEFWRLYNKEAYDRLKSKYDPKGRLADLYRKCVLRV